MYLYLINDSNTLNNVNKARKQGFHTLAFLLFFLRYHTADSSSSFSVFPLSIFAGSTTGTDAAASIFASPNM